jgi:AcrR family transcriptional regulator
MYNWTGGCQLLILPLSTNVKEDDPMAMGRPRAFDVDEALNRALEVFWRKGYEGASLSDLTEAMGINKPSLYAAFGNKEDLFRKALDRYVTEKIGYVREALKAPTARGVAERLLFGAADAMTDPSSPVGCLAIKGVMTCGEEGEALRQEIMKLRANYERELSARLDRAKQEGDLPADTNTIDLMRFLQTVGQGMALQASSGATREELRKVAETALRGLNLG